MIVFNFPPADVRERGRHILSSRAKPVGSRPTDIYHAEDEIFIGAFRGRCAVAQQKINEHLRVSK